MKCATVETALCDAMEEWLDNYIIQLETKVEPTIDPIDTALEAVRGQLSALQDQQENICEYLEKGIYTIDMFTKRNLALTKEIKQLQESEEDLLKQKNADNQQETIHAQIIPAAQHILESYPLLTVEEKNRLWKLVLKKATIYRSPDDEVVIRIYPNLPK
jgi:septal ring factor EnvC (AmiA/AmiB activator)